MRPLALFAIVLCCGAAAAPRRPPGALGNTKDDDEAAQPARAPAPAPAPGDGDVALVRALAWAFEPAPLEIRVVAIEDLALLGDPRALNPLASMIFDGQPAIQDAALDAITHFATPRAVEILSNVIRHPLLADRLKLKSIDALLFQRASAAHEMLASVAEGQEYNPTVRDAARAALEQWGSP